jgi:hypothetical protein
VGIGWSLWVFLPQQRLITPYLDSAEPGSQPRLIGVSSSRTPRLRRTPGSCPSAKPVPSFAERPPEQQDHSNADENTDAGRREKRLSRPVAGTDKASHFQVAQPHQGTDQTEKHPYPAHDKSDNQTKPQDDHAHCRGAEGGSSPLRGVDPYPTQNAVSDDHSDPGSRVSSHCHLSNESNGISPLDAPLRATELNGAPASVARREVSRADDRGHNRKTF